MAAINATNCPTFQGKHIGKYLAVISRHATTAHGFAAPLFFVGEHLVNGLLRRTCKRIEKKH